jgi:hypothetical protein
MCEITLNHSLIVRANAFYHNKIILSRICLIVKNFGHQELNNSGFLLK